MDLLEQRLDEAELAIRKTSFRQNKGLGNEVGYYIFDYPPEKELVVRTWIERMHRKNAASSEEYPIIVFDLYQIVIDILKEKGYMEKTFEMEKCHGIERISKAIGTMLRLTSADGLIVKYICKHTPEEAIVFLTGIGKVYPIIRSHTVLNNLHQVIDRVPVVMFYPGKYDGQTLMLFSEIKDDNYYRAFKLVR